MKIWLDPTPLSQLALNECDDCGECDPYSFIPKKITDLSIVAIPDENAIWSDGTSILQQVSPLYIEACDGETWLVCNPEGTGKVAVVDAEARYLLEQFHFPQTLHEFLSDQPEHNTASIGRAISLFEQLGLLQDIDQPRYTRQTTQSSTLSAWLHVTNACNLRCSYCYLHKTSVQMSDNIAKNAIDAIIRSATRKHFRRVKLKYAGGEASLRLEHVLAIHDYATQQAEQSGLTFSDSILSNGVHLPQPYISLLKARGIRVMISLDGVGEYHDRQRPFISSRGSFKFVNRTIAQLLANDLVPHINVTVSQHNLQGLVSLAEYIIERDLPFTLSYYRSNDCSMHLRDLQFEEQQMIEAMLKVFSYIEDHLPRRGLIGSLIDKADMNAPHEYTCGAGRSYLVIDQFGGVAKCPSDIMRTVTTIYADDPLQNIRDDCSSMQALPVDEKEGCRDCQWRYWCTGGCPMLTYHMTGRNDTKSPNCNIYQTLFPAAMRLEALRLLKYETPLVL